MHETFLVLVAMVNFITVLVVRVILSVNITGSSENSKNLTLVVDLGIVFIIVILDKRSGLHFDCIPID